jgi:hypothetical protein
MFSGEINATLKQNNWIIICEHQISILYKEQFYWAAAVSLALLVYFHCKLQHSYKLFDMALVFKIYNKRQTFIMPFGLSNRMERTQNDSSF